MTRSQNLTEGSITNALTKLALPIIATSFVQMAYNLTDMLWVGRVGSGAVAAVGTAGFFTWLANAIILISKVGAEVGVAQSIGGQDTAGAKSYIRHSLQLIVVLSLLYGAGLIVFRHPLIGFYRLGESIESMARSYLVIVSLGMVFFSLNPIFTGIFNGAGDSTTPFKINVIGLVLNIILDPILIFGFGPIPRLGTTGAAIATVLAQITVTVVFIWEARKRPELFSGLKLLAKPEQQQVQHIVKLGFPVALHSAFFTLIAMAIARILSNWGPLPIAVQQVGSQIESISWMTAGGFQTAMSAFIGQNYGAKKWERLYKGYFIGLGIISILGVFATALLIIGARPLFTLFINEPEAIKHGVVYLRILGLSQLFMCLEIVTAGAFIGHGKTFPPSVVGIGFNVLRIPMALVLSATALGVDGVWWAISISGILKGAVLVLWHLRYLRSHPEMGSLRQQTV